MAEDLTYEPFDDEWTGTEIPAEGVFGGFLIQANIIGAPRDHQIVGVTLNGEVMPITVPRRVSLFGGVSVDTSETQVMPSREAPVGIHAQDFSSLTLKEALASEDLASAKTPIEKVRKRKTTTRFYPIR